MKTKFKDTLLYAILAYVGDTWKDNNLYRFLLYTPFLALVLTVGVAMALFIDFIVALDEG